MDTTKTPNSALSSTFLIAGAAILLMTLHPNVWGFWAMFFKAGTPHGMLGLWFWPILLYGSVLGGMVWNVRQMIRARRARR